MTDKNAGATLLARGKHYGLDKSDCDKVMGMLGRDPKEVELAVIGAMWSEHCSYRSSAKWLERLPTKGERVVCGPGENAGVVDIGEGYGVAFKIESHNHPSVIEPYQGAATGVGGILRDVFTMGARPIALLNALWFGDVKHKKTPYRLDGVTRGIADYGNAVGVPTVAGETNFHAAYNDNILVNAMAVGLVSLENLMLSKASGEGNLVIYGGGTTGRDGVKGAVMASATFESEADFERTTVQIADPFCGRCIMDACQELVLVDGLVAMQDMGAAGLTSSSVEMADKGELGIELWLDKIPVRESNMQPHELMLSESQERMLLVVKPEAVARVFAIFEKYDLAVAVVGKMIKERHLSMLWEGEQVGILPLAPLAGLAPRYDRQRSPVVTLPVNVGTNQVVTKDCESIFMDMMQSPEIASKRAIWEQYDRYVGARFLSGEQGDAAVLDIWENNKAIAVALDSNPYYGAVSPKAGGRAVVCENWRNLIAVGAKPVGFTDNLNAGNPENPDVMRDFAETVEGMAEAAKILGVPFVSGNVSLYNTTGDVSIPQTPVVGGVGLLENPNNRVSIKARCKNTCGAGCGGACLLGATVVLLGAKGSHLGATLYERVTQKPKKMSDCKMPPYMDAEDIHTEYKNGKCLLELCRQGLVRICHDISTGGLLVALTEMLLVNKTGCQITTQANFDDHQHHGFWFGENPGRYLLLTHQKEELQQQAAVMGVKTHTVGAINSGKMLLQSETKRISLKRVQEWFENGLEANLNT